MAVVAPKYLQCRGGCCCIRTAELSDAPALVALAHRLSSETDYVTRQPDEVTTTLDEQAALIREHISGPRHLQLVATVDEQVVGGLRFSARPLVRYQHQGEFGVGIWRDFWGRGIGTALVSTLCSWADSAGIVKLTLIVDSENVRAVSLYERLGFVVEGALRKDSKHGEVFRDALLMARIIDGKSGA